MSSLEEQLAEVFARGLEDDPELRASLEEALSSSGDSKATKAEANYGEAETDAESCNTCKHFDGSSRCDVVSGIIRPTGISDYYEGISKQDAGSGERVDS